MKQDRAMQNQLRLCGGGVGLGVRGGVIRGCPRWAGCLHSKSILDVWL